MVQRQAQVDEVRWSRLQTELASSQNLSVMIFTTFTVLFLPLSFFTSLFGMNTKEWGGDDDNFLSLGVIGAISRTLAGSSSINKIANTCISPRISFTYRRHPHRSLQQPRAACLQSGLQASEILRPTHDNAARETRAEGAAAGQAEAQAAAGEARAADDASSRTRLRLLGDGEGRAPRRVRHSRYEPQGRDAETTRGAWDLEEDDEGWVLNRV